MFKQLFIWWSGQTIGTMFYTWRNGNFVGKDDSGNSFFQSSDCKKRWVIYNDEIEASKVSAEWHGWLHHTFKEPPVEKPLIRKTWEREHIPNYTGTHSAYHPRRTQNSVKTITDYEAWRPDE